jgi:hypothetical protein
MYQEAEKLQRKAVSKQEGSVTSQYITYTYWLPPFTVNIQIINKS